MATDYRFVDSSGLTRFEGTLSPDPPVSGSPTFTGTLTCANLTATGNVALGDAGTDTLGFYGHAATAQQTGVAVSAAGIHAALVALGLITA